MRYKFYTGSFAWLLHRITGVSLTLYIFIHLYVLSHLKDPAKYKSLMAFMENPLVKLSEVALLALVITHAVNGSRLVLIDMGVPTKLHKPLFWAGALAGGALFVLGAWPIIGGHH